MVYKELEDNLLLLLKSTENLSFPFFASDEQKISQLLSTKDEIDKQIDLILKKNKIETKVYDKRNDIWESVQKESAKKFETLPEKLKHNSFYYQEIMHMYVEKQIDIIKGEI